VIHQSDSDVKSHDNIDTIRGWHVKERNFIDVGYHYFIRKSGQIEKGREIEIVGAHCLGVNGRSVGVCLSGRSKFTREQFEALEVLIFSIWGKIGYRCDVDPHSKYSNKICPNFDVPKFMRSYVENI
jgi:hypothetical protein